MEELQARDADVQTIMMRGSNATVGAHTAIAIKFLRHIPD